MPDLVDRLKTALAGRYAIERELGQGGMGTVFLARDLRHEREVALKVLKPELAAAVGAERFLREIRTTAQLSHPHILPLLDSGDADGALFYVMPFVAGESLRDRLRRERQLAVEDAVRMGSEVADALSYAHARGIVHRDIKPENILLQAGHAVVADFGIARVEVGPGEGRLTTTGMAIGSPLYMSPEQAAADPVIDGRSDLYALGCTLYEILAGHPPFQGTTLNEIRARHVMDPIPHLAAARPGIPEAVDRVIQRAMAKVPADRFTDATQMAKALRRLSLGSIPRPMPDVAVRRVGTRPVGSTEHFQGRERELQLTDDFLNSRSLRLLTIVGRNGVGKTALACRALDDRLERGVLDLPVDGVAYVDVSAEDALTVTRLLDALRGLLTDKDARDTGGAQDDPPGRFRSLLEQTASRAHVVLMDGLERATDPALGCLTQADLREALELFLSAPEHGLKVILTTTVLPRELLSFQPTRQVTLHLDDGLPAPHAENLLRALDRDGHLGLAQAPGEVLATARVVTGGSPRALELLFAALAADRDLTLQELTVGGARSLPEAVVEAFVGRACALLPPEDRAVLDTLAVLGQGVPADAVDAVSQTEGGGSEARAPLKRLVNARLVHREGSNYALHPADRDYLLGDLSRRDENKLRELRRAAVEYFHAQWQARTSCTSVADLEPALGEVEQRLALDQPESAAAVLGVLTREYLLRWGHAALARALWVRTLPSLRDVAVRLQAHKALGSALWQLGDYQGARTQFGQGLSLAETLRDIAGQAACLGNMATCEQELGEITAAIDHYEKAVVLSKTGEAAGHLTYHIGNLGNCLRAVGRLRDGRRHIERALGLARESGNREFEARMLYSLGVTCDCLGDSEAATRHLEAVLPLAGELQLPLVLSGALAYLGDLQLARGNASGAQERYKAALQLAEPTGNPDARALGRAGLATAQLLMGEPGNAARLLEEAVPMGEPLTVYYLLALYGIAQLRRGARDTAMAAFHEAMTSADQALAREPRLYEAVEVRALALTGLAVLGGGRDGAAAAGREWLRARRLVHARGIMRRRQDLVNLLAPADTAGVIPTVLKAVRGSGWLPRWWYG